MDMRKLVGRNGRAARVALDLTQEQLAEISGFSQQYISDLERGRRNPTIVSLYELSLALKVTPVALRGEAPNLDPARDAPTGLIHIAELAKWRGTYRRR